MKKVLAFAALLMGSHLQAGEVEPIRQTSRYYYVGSEKDFMMLLSDSVQVRGDHRRLWSLTIPHETIKSDEGKFEYIWVLIDVDCPAAKWRFEKAEFTDGKASAVVDVAAPYADVRVGSPSATIHDVVCHANLDNTKVVAADLVAQAALAYRAKRF